jgi:chromosome segregation ATPase
MIDFIDCDQRFAACLDLAAKSKLFSIIVEDLEAAKDILSLNSQIKGGVINIFPLSMADQQQDK